MLFSHCGEYPCKSKTLTFAANSPKMVRLARQITETSEALQMVTNACECLRMPLRILRMLVNALRMKRLQNACAAKPLANVSLFHFYSLGYLE